MALNALLSRKVVANAVDYNVILHTNTLHVQLYTLNQPAERELH